MKIVSRLQADLSALERAENETGTVETLSWLKNLDKCSRECLPNFY